MTARFESSFAQSFSTESMAYLVSSDFRWKPWKAIAWMQFKQILRRDGLQRRSVLIDIAPDAIRQTAARGCDPAMGARALKRQIERDLVRPAAEVLAASSIRQPTLLRLFLEGGEVKTWWQRVEFVDQKAASPPLLLDRLCELATNYHDDVAMQFEGQPLRYEMGDGGLDPQLLETMTLRDSLRESQDLLRELRDAHSQPRLQRPQSTPIQLPSGGAPTGTGAIHSPYEIGT